MSSNKNTNKSLGVLETEIMRVLWGCKNCTVRDVVSKLKSKKAYTTVMTVMDRLYNKKILKREKNKNGAYIYKSTKTKEEFYGQMSKNIITNLISDFGEVAVSQFVDAVKNSNDKQIKEWKNKLSKIK